MKKIAAFAAIVAITVSLVACASTAPKEIKVKCPACGYEFTTPYEGN